MPRDSAGNYSLEAGNPVATGTLIEANWANTTLDDIAQALTDSLSRQGEGGMLAPFQFANGTKGQPSITWTAEPTMGFYREAFNDMRLVIGNIDNMRWINEGGIGKTQVWNDAEAQWEDVAHENDTILFEDGTVAEPAISWWEETTMGWFRSAAGIVDWVADGITAILRMDGTDGMSRFRDLGLGGGDEWIPYATELMPPPPGVSDQEVATTGYVDSAYTLIAQGRGDGNTNTFRGDPIGVASSGGWIFDSTGRYTLTLANPYSSGLNVVCHLTGLGDGGAMFSGNVGSVAGGAGSGTVITIIFRNSSGAFINPDEVMFTVFDTGN